MKKSIMSSVVTVLAISMGSGLLIADTAYDRSSGNPSQETGSAPNIPTADAPNPSGAMAAPTEAQALPPNWTKAQGTVESVDAVSREVKLKDAKGNVSQVTIDPNVTIKKDGKKVDVSQLQTGDSITLTRKKPAMEQNKG